MVQSNLFGAAIAFFIGAAIAAAGYFLSRHMLLKNPSRYSAVEIVKNILTVVYLVALFLIGPRTPWDRMWLLIGGCLGLTLPMIWFTYRLVQLNNSLHKKEDSSDE